MITELSENVSPSRAKIINFWKEGNYILTTKLVKLNIGVCPEDRLHRDAQFSKYINHQRLVKTMTKLAYKIWLPQEHDFRKCFKIRNKSLELKNIIRIHSFWFIDSICLIFYFMKSGFFKKVVISNLWSSSNTPNTSTETFPKDFRRMSRIRLSLLNKTRWLLRLPLVKSYGNKDSYSSFSLKWRHISINFIVYMYNVYYIFSSFGTTFITPNVRPQSVFERTLSKIWVQPKLVNCFFRCQIQPQFEEKLIRELLPLHHICSPEFFCGKYLQNLLPLHKIHYRNHKTLCLWRNFYLLRISTL